MMSTPICDFVRCYDASGFLRLHMPGHKGTPLLGPENLDITEISGADSLYDAQGIIAESERNAGSLFNAHTFYSTEGSSLCIRAMLFLLRQHIALSGQRPLILAGRNAHKAFLSAAALLDFDVQWLFPDKGQSYLSCNMDFGTVERTLSTLKPAALYVTSPDYLGNRVPIDRLSEICHKQGALLLVDNAHGAYLRFLKNPSHPMDLGADMCCDSAHKTLPVLTGGAYLHISPGLSPFFSENAKQALALFGSTSPSYLILQSLDAANRLMDQISYREDIRSFANDVETLRERLCTRGFSFTGDEPLKLTLCTKSYGYRGEDFAMLLRQRRIECEFADPDFVVLMLTPQIGKKGLEKLEQTLHAIPRLPPLKDLPPPFVCPQQVCSLRDALLSPSEEIPAKESLNRILANATVGCPPAVPIAVCGERINESCLRAFSYYNIGCCTVLKE